jgi:hypothetical protein
MLAVYATSYFGCWLHYGRMYTAVQAHARLSAVDSMLWRVLDFHDLYYSQAGARYVEYLLLGDGNVGKGSRLIGKVQSSCVCV